MNEMNPKTGDFLPKDDKLTQLKNSDSYKTLEQKRAQHKSYDLFTKEVKFHRELIKNTEIEKIVKKPDEIFNKRPLSSGISHEKTIRKSSRPESSSTYFEKVLKKPNKFKGFF